MYSSIIYYIIYFYFAVEIYDWSANFLICMLFHKYHKVKAAIDFEFIVSSYAVEIYDLSVHFLIWMLFHKYHKEWRCQWCDELQCGSLFAPYFPPFHFLKKPQGFELFNSSLQYVLEDISLKQNVWDICFVLPIAQA